MAWALACEVGHRVTVIAALQTREAGACVCTF